MSRLSFPALLIAALLSAAIWCTSTTMADHPAGIRHMPFDVDKEEGGGFEPRYKYEEDADGNTPTTVSAVGTLEQMEAFNRAHPEQTQRAVRNLGTGGTQPEAPNGVIQAPGDTEPLAPPLSASFIGIIDNNSLIPPDTDGAVGPNHVFEFTNLGRTIYNKAGGIVNTLITMPSFWSSLGAPGASTSDPHVLYDQYTGRWLVSGIGFSGGQWMLVGVSQGADPAGPYNLFGIQMDVSTCGFNHVGHKIDFDLMGFDPNNVIVTVNIFNSGLTARIHSDVYIINKARMLASNAPLVCSTDFQIVHDPCGTPNGLGNTNYAPSVTFGQTPGNAINYIVDDGWFDATDATTLQNRYYRFATVTGVGATAVYDCLGDNGFIGVLGCYNFNQAGAQQPSPCSQLIATNSYNITSPPIVRNGKIWFTHSAGAPVAGCPNPQTNPAATRSQVYWVEQDPANIIPGFPDQNGAITDPALAFYFPSLAVNSCDAVMIGFSGSSTSQFAAGMYTGRVATDPPNTMQAVGTTKVGEATYLKTFGALTARNRWGDYSGTCVDPADDQTMWTLQEYARPSVGGSCPTNNTGRFATWWSSMPIACVPTGACCIGVGNCQVLTSAQCNAQGGSYYGDNVACGSQCQVTGSENGCGNGDANCDGQTDLNDIAPFVQALLDPAGYLVAHPTCFLANCDTNCDLTIDGLDIQSFTLLLVSFSTQEKCRAWVVAVATPCPSGPCPGAPAAPPGPDGKCTHSCLTNADCLIPGFWNLTVPCNAGGTCTMTISHGGILNNLCDP